MTSVREQSRDQYRWDDYGGERLHQLAEDPSSFVVDGDPHANQAHGGQLLRALGPLPGKRLLEVGCGRGEFAVFLAKRGARVAAIDVGPTLIASAERLGTINDVECSFKVASATSLPFPSDSFDAIVGVSVLHHLSESGAAAAFQEAYRVLKPAGVCVFYEPVENSRVFNFLQNLVPAGRPGEPGYRPSLLQRVAWAEYRAIDDQRAMTTREMARAGSAPFRSAEITPYGFLARLARTLGDRYRRPLRRVDTALYKLLPPVRYLCRTGLARYVK